MKVSTEVLCLSAAVSAAVSAVATYYYVKISTNFEDVKISTRIVATTTPKVNIEKYDQDIIDEEQARTRAFLKPEGIKKLNSTTVAVVGCGGVGSWVANMLCRGGIGKLILIDFDQVSLSSLNRHATATLEDVGTSKVSSIKKYLQKVCPWVEIVDINELWNKDGGPALLEGADYVVDCIDNIDTKVDLLAYCSENKIPVISSMGAGAKADPTRVTIGDISTTYEDPLSRAVRIKLRYRGIRDNIAVVYSTEKPGKNKAKLLEISDDQLQTGQVGELSVLKDFRVRVLPVLGPIPGLFGLTIATHLMNTIGGYDSVFDPAQGGYSLAGKKRTQLYESMLSSVIGQLARLDRKDVPSCINLDDVEYLMEEVWRGKTLNGNCSRQKLTLWDPSKPRNIHNMVPVTKEEQKRHEDEVLKGGKALSEVYSAETLEYVNKRMELDLWYQQFRVN